MKMRDSWYQPEGAAVLESVCIWCLRNASLCILVDPCGDREAFEVESEVVDNYQLLEDVPTEVTRVVSQSRKTIASKRDGRWWNASGGVVPLDACGPWIAAGEPQ